MALASAEGCAHCSVCVGRSLPVKTELPREQLSLVLPIEEVVHEELAGAAVLRRKELPIGSGVRESDFFFA